MRRPAVRSIAWLGLFVRNIKSVRIIPMPDENTVLKQHVCDGVPISKTLNWIAPTIINLVQPALVRTRGGNNLFPAPTREGGPNLCEHRRCISWLDVIARLSTSKHEYSIRLCERDLNLFLLLLCQGLVDVVARCRL